MARMTRPTSLAGSGWSPMLARLLGAELLAVVGPSGSGKPSLVRAGLLPALAAGTLPGSERRQLVLTPGERPAEVLERARWPTCQRRGSHAAWSSTSWRSCSPWRWPASVRPSWIGWWRRCVRRMRRWSRSSPCGRTTTATAATTLNPASWSSSPTTVLVGAMGPEELGRAIEVPAELAGLEVEPGVLT